MKINYKKLAIFIILIVVVIFLFSIAVKGSSKIIDRSVWTPLNLVESDLLFSDVDGKEWLLMKPYQSSEDLTFSKTHILFETAANTADEWDYIYLDSNKYQWKNYSWKFNAIRHTEFREFAFNFRNQDFDNRYRYRFEENKIFFDKKIKGSWINNIASTPFIMELGRSYQIKIDSYDSIFRCWVDGQLMLENVDTDISKGSISIILWEDNGKTNIRADVYNNRVVKLVRP
jgi:hypothetical protein